MSMLRLAIFGGAVLLIAGCTPSPFREVDLVSLEGADPWEVREQFALALPLRFRIVSTVTFQLKRQTFSAIGYTDVDASAGTFTLVGLHPAWGIKLFELWGDPEGVECRFALEEFSRWSGFARAVADDTRGIYFDRIPSPDAKVSKGRYRIYFRQETPAGEIEYVFAGRDGLLVEKRYYEEGSRIWSASYHDYRVHEGKLFPGGIILEHHEHGYQLVVRLKEIRS